MPTETSIAALKHRYSQALLTKRAELRVLEEKLALLSEIENEAAASDARASTPSAVSGKRYANMGLTEAALDAVTALWNENGQQVASDRAAIGRYMVKNGFEPKGKNFAVSLDQTLRRLSSSRVNRLNSTLEGKNRVYFPK